MLNIMITHTPYYLQHALYIHVTTLDKGNVNHMQYHICTMLSPHLHTVYGTVQMYIHVTCIHSLSLLNYKATILGTVSHIIHVCSLRYFHIQENVAHCCEQIVSL